MTKDSDHILPFCYFYELISHFNWNKPVVQLLFWFVCIMSPIGAHVGEFGFLVGGLIFGLVATVSLGGRVILKEGDHWRQPCRFHRQPLSVCIFLEGRNNVSSHLRLLLPCLPHPVYWISSTVSGNKPVLPCIAFVGSFVMRTRRVADTVAHWELVCFFSFAFSSSLVPSYSE